jgi:predicted hotdog family 3-hydroxylacyl-ACP dehydratase
MNKPLVSKDEITDYIPQKHPIVMIDTIEEVHGAETKTSLLIRSDNMFVADGKLTEAGIVENIAQTAAAKAGYEVKKHGAQPLIGFIGAVKDLKIHSFPQLNETLLTTVTVKNEVMGVTIIDGTSYCGERKIAECEMKIFLKQPDN